VGTDIQVDSLFVLATARIRHSTIVEGLVIPHPLFSRKYNRTVTKMNIANTHLTVAGRSITIRPILLTDTEIEAEFDRDLSPQSKHHRFLGGTGELSAKEIKHLVDVDGHRSMAFLATITEGGKEKAIGVSRYARDSDDQVCEMAVTVADAWQPKGLGMQMTQQLIAYAKAHGISHLYALDLADNHAMWSLAKEIGMTATQDPEDIGHIIYSLEL